MVTSWILFMGFVSWDSFYGIYWEILSGHFSYIVIEKPCPFSSIIYLLKMVIFLFANCQMTRLRRTVGFAESVILKVTFS